MSPRVRSSTASSLTVALWALLLVQIPRSARAQQPVDAPAAAPAGSTSSPRVILPPQLTRFVQAEFPPSEIAAGKGATVVLQIAIDATGRVVAVTVAQSASPDFDAAALAAATQFQFAPATVDGQPIPVKVSYRYQFTLTEQLVKKITADFVGTIRERSGKQPIANVRVALDSGQQALTDELGKFAINDVAPGEHGVTLSGEAIDTVATSETFEPGKRLDATYDIDKKRADKSGDDDEEQIVVIAVRLKKQIVSTEVQASQAQKVPGAQGDVLKVVESLPGVARAAVGSGALIVWGASPEDTRVYIEGIHVPRLYHDGGYRSILPSGFVKSVELIPGGYGPAYGRGLGGIVTVSLRPLDDEGVHGSVGADIIDASTDVRAKLGKNVHVALGARKSYLDAVLPQFTSADVGDYIPIPRYWDGEARVVVDLAAHESVELGALASSDRIHHTLLNPDPGLTTRQTLGTDFQRLYLRYERHATDGSVIRAVPWFGFDSTSLLNVFGTTPTDQQNSSTVFGFRADWQGTLLEHVHGNVGLDAETTFSTLHRSGSIGAPPREGDQATFGEPPPSQVNSDDWKTVVLGFGAFASVDAALFDERLHVVPGARFEPMMVMTNKTIPTAPDTAVGYWHQQDALEPRLAVRYAVTPRVTAKAAFGQYHQAPQAEDLSAAFGTPTLGLSRAKHYLAGAAVQVSDSLAVEATAFLSESQALVVRSQAESPYLAHALDQTGIGRSYGTQLLVRRQELGRFFGWVSYTLIRSQRKDAPGQAWRLFDYDQTHVFTALASYDLGAGFELGGRLRFATGYPRTPLTGSYFDALTNSYEPIFGPHNSTRIPPFAALDLRIAKHFRWQKIKGECYLDLQNVTNRQNAEELVYNTTYAQRGYITGMPILPVLGMRLTW